MLSYFPIKLDERAVGKINNSKVCFYSRDLINLRINKSKRNSFQLTDIELRDFNFRGFIYNSI